MREKRYKIQYTYSSREDIRRMKKYILDTFKYRELGENFTKKMKSATEGLKLFPKGFGTIGFRYRGYDIYMRPYHTYLFFYVVDEDNRNVIVLRVLQESMNWQLILKQWLKKNN